MKILIDTNVLLDVALKRDDFFEYSYAALCECIDTDDEMYVAATSLKDVFYIVERLQDVDAAYEAVQQILAIATAATIDDAICRNALNLERPDYEDGLIAAAMDADSLSLILTRDKQAFRDKRFSACTPKDFLSRRGYEPVELDE